jgi:pyruvate dehydrogenase E2 component (dihydrolipoamide acetyltransferase)
MAHQDHPAQARADDGRGHHRRVVQGEGDPVAQKGEALFSVESDKAVLEVEARAAGVLRKVLRAQAGTTVPIMTPVGIVGAAGRGYQRPTWRDEPALGRRSGRGPRLGGGAPDRAARCAKGRTGRSGARVADGRIFASPRARRVAAERGIDLALVTGSGPNGRIIERDVLAYAAASPRATPLARRLAAQEAGLPLTAVPAAGGRVSPRRGAGGAAPTPAPRHAPLADGRGGGHAAWPGCGRSSPSAWPPRRTPRRPSP